MGAIINYTSFTDGLLYLNLSNEDDRDSMNNKYCPFVEKKMLTKLLGESLYNDFIGNKTVQKYANLINGVDATYEYNGKTKKYTGLKDMLAYFTYFQYVSRLDKIPTQSGFKRVKNQNSESVSPASEMCEAWNEGVSLYYQAIDFINYTNDQTPNTYADFDPEDIGTINIWGI